KAYMAAARMLVPPAGEPWVDPDAPLTWGNAESFYDALRYEIEDRLTQAALASGDLRAVPWTEDDYREFAPAEVAGVQGATPPASAVGASMAHGCAALDPAVGPAPESARVAADAAPEAEGGDAASADRAFSCLPGQKL